MSQERRGEELGRERIGRLLARLAIPGIVAMLVNSLYNVVDTIFVGHGVGALAIGGLAVAFPLQMFVMGLSHLAGLGAASIVSRALGAGDPERADTAAANGLLLAAALAAVYAVVGLAFTDPLLRAFGATDGLMVYSRPYIRIIYLGVVFNAVGMAGASLAQAGGAARAAMRSTIIGGLANVVLDPVFIFGFHLGVAGAAWATIISQLASLLYILRFLFGAKSPLRLKPRHFVPQIPVLRAIAAIGFSPFLRSITSTVFSLVVNNVLRIHGGDSAITVFGIANRVVAFLFLPSLGIVQALQPIAGYNYGARRLDRVRRVVLVALASALGLGAVGWIAVQLASHVIVRAFTSNAAILRHSSRVLRIMFSAEPLMAVQMVGSTLYQAMGRAVPAAILAMLRQFLILTPLLLVLPRFLGLEGVWLSFPLANVAASAVVAAMLVRETASLRRQEALPRA